MTEDQSMPDQTAGAFEAEQRDPGTQDAQLRDAEESRARVRDARPGSDQAPDGQLGDGEVPAATGDDRGERERRTNIPVTGGSHVDGPQPESGQGEWLEGGQPMVEAVDPHNERVESRDMRDSPGSSASTVADATNFSGEKRPAPQVGDAEQAASRESRRLAEAQDTEQ